MNSEQPFDPKILSKIIESLSILSKSDSDAKINGMVKNKAILKDLQTAVDNRRDTNNELAHKVTADWKNWSETLGQFPTITLPNLIDYSQSTSLDPLSTGLSPNPTPASVPPSQPSSLPPLNLPSLDEAKIAYLNDKTKNEEEFNFGGKRSRSKKSRSKKSRRYSIRRR